MRYYNFAVVAFVVFAVVLVCGSVVPQLAFLVVRVHAVNALSLARYHDNHYYHRTMDRVGVTDDGADPRLIFHLAVFGSKHVLHLILL